MRNHRLGKVTSEVPGPAGLRYYVAWDKEPHSSLIPAHELEPAAAPPPAETIETDRPEL